MANPYAYNVLTFDGANLIAQATAANPIVIVGAISRATAASSDDDLAAKDASWYTGKTGTIEAVSASNNVAKIVARFDPEGARQDAKSIAVKARLASQTDADAIVLTAKSDPDATAILPGSGDTLSYVRFPFNIYIQTSGSVQVTPGASASIADLERFVSTHKAGNPTQGEAQVVRGTKIFPDGISISRVGPSSGDVLYAGGNFVTEIDESFSLGFYNFDVDIGYRWNSLYLSGNAYVGGAVYLGGNEHYISLTGAGALQADVAGIEPVSDNEATLGTADNRWKSINAHTVRTVSIVSENPGTDEINVLGDLCPAISNYTLGWSGREWKAIYAKKGVIDKLVLDDVDGNGIEWYSAGNYARLTCSLVPHGSANYDLGNASNIFDNVYANNFIGCIAYQSSTVTAEPGIGAIFFGGVTYSGAATLNAGTRISIGGNVSAIGTCMWESASPRFTGLYPFTNPQGVYVLLCGSKKTQSETNFYALMMRVE